MLPAVDVDELTRRWWVPVLRGIAAILFGIFALVAPGLSLVALVWLWGAYAIADGALNVLLALRARRRHMAWGWLLFAGLVSIAAGVVTFAWPRLTAFVLLFIIAAWAVLTGIAAIVTAIRIREQVEGEWLLGLSGVLSIVLGVLLLAFPASGALALVWLIGAYAVVFGSLLVGTGVFLRRWRRAGARRTVPPGGVPTAA